MPLQPLPLAARPLLQPARCRLPDDAPHRAEILARHADAVRRGETGYPDPATGLLVLTAAWLAARQACCGNGCRHCPYVEDQA